MSVGWALLLPLLLVCFLVRADAFLQIKGVLIFAQQTAVHTHTRTWGAGVLNRRALRAVSAQPNQPSRGSG